MSLGGHVPERRSPKSDLTSPPDETFSEFHEGTGDREASTTMGLVRMLSRLMRDRELGEHIVPIVPDESRTFGMEGMFREFGIYASAGQLYEPVDSDRLLYYKESRDGQILEEGITEAGAMSSFIAGGTAYSSLKVPMIPFFIFYSMFGLQRFGDLAYAAGDARDPRIPDRRHRRSHDAERRRAPAPGRTQPPARLDDPQSRRLRPRLRLRDRRHRAGRHPPHAQRRREHLLLHHGRERGIHPAADARVGESCAKASCAASTRWSPDEAPQVRLLGSGPILNEVRTAQQILREDFGIRADVWSVTSYTELRREALQTDRWNRLHPVRGRRAAAWLETSLGQCDDRQSSPPATTPPPCPTWSLAGCPVRLTALGTDGFGRSDTREALRDHFEVDAGHVVWSALSALSRRDEIDGDTLLLKARDQLGIDPSRPDPMTASREHPYDDHAASDPGIVLLPDLGEDIEEADVLQIYVSVGDQIALEQPIVEIETEKATLDLPSSVAGVVTETSRPPGRHDPPGDPVLSVDSGTCCLHRRLPTVSCASS